MSQRHSVGATRSSALWVVILLILGSVVAAVVGVMVITPQISAQREAQARAAEAERHYQAGEAFQKVGDWAAAEAEYKQVISLDVNYKEVQALLAEVRAKATTHEAQTQEAVQATAAVGPTATAAALEMRYQRALGLVNLKQWVEAQAELRAIFDIDPNYRDVQAQLTLTNAEAAKLVPTSTPTPLASQTPIPSPTPAVPTLRWLGIVSDQVRPSVSDNSADGSLDGVFELVLNDVGKEVTHIILRRTDANGRHLDEHWDTDGEGSWILGVVDSSTQQRLDRPSRSLDLTIETPRTLRCYASVAGSGFRPGEYYAITITFSDGYGLTLPPLRIPAG
jgi:tetratricopeptide (TPR) repeat protein